jgi:hypothetical protein
VKKSSRLDGCVFGARLGGDTLELVCYLFGTLPVKESFDTTEVEHYTRRLAPVHCYNETGNTRSYRSIELAHADFCHRLLLGIC